MELLELFARRFVGLAGHLEPLLRLKALELSACPVADLSIARATIEAQVAEPVLDTRRFRGGIESAEGDRFEGEVVSNLPGTEFAATVVNLDHAMFRFGIENYGSGPEASIWLSTWGDAETAEPFRGRFSEMLSRLFKT